MDAKTLAEAKAELEKLMDEAVDSHEPVVITREGKPPVVLVSLDDWSSKAKTDYLLASPKNRARLLQSVGAAGQGQIARTLTPDDLARLLVDPPR